MSDTRQRTAAPTRCTPLIRPAVSRRRSPLDGDRARIRTGRKRHVLGRHTIDPRAGSATAAARAVTSGSTRRGSGRIPPPPQSETATLRVTALGKQPHLLPLRSRRHREPLLVFAHRTTSADTRITTRTTHAGRAAMESASSISSPQRSGAFDPDTNTSERVDVDLRSPRIGRNRRFVDGVALPALMGCPSEGHTLGLATRGSSSRCELGTGTASVRRAGRRPVPAPAFHLRCGSRSCAFPTKAARKRSRSTTRTAAPRRKRLEKVDIGRALEVAPSPKANQIVLTNHRKRADLRRPRGEPQPRDRPQRPRSDRDPAWSPDGRYVAYGSP